MTAVVVSARSLAVLVLVLTLSHTQELRAPEAVSNPCIGANSCGECIRTARVCAWCSSEKHPRSKPRCDIYELLKTSCPAQNLTYPMSSMQVVQNHNVRGGGGVSQPIQVQPQILNFTARTNDPLYFKLTFRQAENYPVDLYFLLDLSYTMVEEEEAQRRLINLGQDMPASMENITGDFNLGFGTFVDKRVMPYTAWSDSMLLSRCPLPDKSCRHPHDFINQLQLSKNGPAFAAKMRDALNAVSQSFDDSEGGMDGLMQSLACEQQIGWRKRSRRIIVYSSNSIFHMAGDGLLGGATKNNDGECYLVNNAYNPADVKFDYPSVSQIAHKLDEKSTSVIFAVMPSVITHYEKLRGLLGSAEIGALSDKSSNIIELIRNNYDKLRSRIHFLPKRAHGVDFKFRSKCLGDVMKETAMCDDLEIKDSVTFDVSMTVNQDVCEGKSGVIDKTVEVGAQGLGEKLTINLRIICDCECERPGKEVVKSENCNKTGTFECGICSCDPGRYGRQCECSEEDISSEKSLEECRGNFTEVCSGQGECICGVCECFTLGPDTARHYSGAHCECNKYNCPRSVYDSSLCGGPTHGDCGCDGQCVCTKDWEGPACDCSTDNATCEASNGLLCNGKDKGTCVCGKCVCNTTSKYMGPTCEECPNCPSKCSQFRDCVECQAFGTGNYNGLQCTELCKTKVTKVPALEQDNDLVRNCDFRDDRNCFFHFSYEYDQSNKLILKVQREKDCPKEVNLGLILGPVVAGIVLIPLLLLCIFICIRNRRDAAEFARFMKEKDKARWESGANPIYKDPKSTFKNPTYKGGK